MTDHDQLATGLNTVETPALNFGLEQVPPHFGFDPCNLAAHHAAILGRFGVEDLVDPSIGTLGARNE